MGSAIMRFLILSVTLGLLGTPEVQGHDKGKGTIAYFDAYLTTGDKCGPQKPISSGWVVKQKYYKGTSTTQDKTDYFVNGVFTVKTDYIGAYPCCMSARGKQGGYYDFSMSRNGLTTRVAAMGSRNTGVTSNGWESFSTCTIQRMGDGVTIQMNLESGGSNDCIEDTDTLIMSHCMYIFRLWRWWLIISLLFT